ncbi:MAG: TetR/AcrR family transcriptional regulator, partial [Pseudomonadota bacterium]|nr:TetR/AcrR family transcriptional regulator [Pseudomonadota bacterium]
MSKPQGSNKEMFDSTRQKFIEKAHDRFIAQGYMATSTNDIVHDAEMARGALYHHFKNKEELFKAVIEDKIHQLQTVLNEQMEKRVHCGISNPEEDLLVSLDVIVDLFKDQSYRRLIVIESLVALPHEQRRETMHDYFKPIVMHFFDQLNITEKATPEVLEAMIIGLIGFMAESVRSFEYMDDDTKQQQHGEDIKQAIRYFL